MKRPRRWMIIQSSDDTGEPRPSWHTMPKSEPNMPTINVSQRTLGSKFTKLICQISILIKSLLLIIDLIITETGN